MGMITLQKAFSDKNNLCWKNHIKCVIVAHSTLMLHTNIICYALCITDCSSQDNASFTDDQ